MKTSVEAEKSHLHIDGKDTLSFQQAEVGLSLMEISNEDIRLSEVESPPVVTTPISQRKLLSPRSRTSQPEIFLLRKVETGEWASDEDVAQLTSKDALITEPLNDDDSVVDRRYSSPEYRPVISGGQIVDTAGSELKGTQTCSQSCTKRVEL